MGNFPINCFVALVVRIAVLALLPAMASHGACNNYYVAPWGSDEQPGTESEPWRTFGKAAGAVVACDTVHVRGGVYYDRLAVSASGTLEAPITFAAYPGETPVIDGEEDRPGAGYALIDLHGDYLVASGLEVRNSTAYGVHLEGHHNVARNLNVHHVRDQGILARGDYSVVEDSTVWDTCRFNYQGAGNGMWGNGIVATRDWENGITDGAILRRNTVFHNWGEGLATFEANGTTIEDNVVYDNWAVNLYVADATDVTVQRNLVYSTQNNPVGQRRCGICLSDEVAFNPSSDIRIVNNMVFGNRRNFGWFAIYPGSRMNGVLVAHNTFVSGDLEDTLPNVILEGGDHRGFLFVNNIVYRAGGGATTLIDPGAVGDGTGLRFTNNLWSATPETVASDVNDVIGDPLLLMTEPDARWFKLSKGSPAAGSAAPLDEVSDDFFGRRRVGVRDLGAHERTRPKRTGS